MRHAREDYARIQDPEGRIPVDEPVFLLRGQDRIAAIAVRIYARMAATDPDHDPELVASALGHADLMEAWPVQKTPDLPRRESTETIPPFLSVCGAADEQARDSAAAGWNVSGEGPL